MDKKKASILLIIPLLLLIPNLVFGENVGQTTQEKLNDRKLLSINEDGSETFLWISKPERILNQNNEYVDYIFTNNSNNLQVETAHGSLRLDKTTCSFSFFPKGLIDQNQNPFFTDSIIARNAVNGTDSWNNVNSVNNAACQPSWNGTALTATKTALGVGTLKYTYLNDNGKWKTLLEVENLSSLTNRKFAFTQTINLNKDTIKFGNTIRNIDNFNNTKFDRQWIEAHESKLIDLLNGVNFDFDLAYDKLWSITVYDTGQNSSKISFDFAKDSTILLPNQKRVYDPTFGYSGPSVNLAPQANLAGTASASCNTASYATNSGGTRVQKRDSATAAECGSKAWQFDVTTITDGSTINSATIRYDVTVNSNPINCDFTQVTVDLSTATGQQAWEDVVGVTTNTDYVSNDASCTSTGTGYTETLGSTFNSYLQTTGLTNNRIAIGMFFNDQTRDASNHSIDVSNGELQVVYTTTPKPNAVTTLTATAVSKTQIDLDWDEPELHGESLIGYQINYTTPYGTPLTIKVNNTGTSTSSYSHTGLVACTQYTHRVSAWTAGGNNVTLGTKANATTACFTPPSTPTLSATAESDTAVRFTSVNGTTGDFNITWYGLRCVENSASSWSTIVSNSSVPSPRVYIYGSLTTADTVTCQWRDGSPAGWGPWSNNATGTPVLDIIESQRPANADRLTRLAAWFDSMGGVYMGMSLFPFLVMMIGLLARPRTTHIFVIITLAFMGILHGSGYYQYPDWYWALSLLFGIVIVLARVPR